MFNQQRYPNLIKMNDRFQLKSLDKMAAFAFVLQEIGQKKQK